MNLVIVYLISGLCPSKLYTNKIVNYAYFVKRKKRATSDPRYNEKCVRIDRSSNDTHYIWIVIVKKLAD